MLRTTPILLCVMASTAAAQQGGWLIESSNVVSPSQPTSTVEVWAWFDDPTGERDAFASGDFDFLASSGQFLNAQTVLFGSGVSAGTIRGDAVTGVIAGQWWGGLGIFADKKNPILVWSVEWTTTDFTLRTVSLSTLNTTAFSIGTSTGHGSMNLLELYPQGFTPGTGMVTVTPSPATKTPLLALGAIALRRRRST